jgi:chemotaxis signal transduction protein
MNNNNLQEDNNKWFQFNIGDNQAIINVFNIVHITAYNKNEMNDMIDNSVAVNGLIDALGHPMPVLDLNKYINIPDKPKTDLDQKDETMILIVKITNEETGQIKKIGLKTEVITDTIILDENAYFFEQEPGLLFHKFFHDIVKINNKFIYKFDVEELFREIPRKWEDN